MATQTRLVCDRRSLPPLSLLPGSAYSSALGASSSPSYKTVSEMEECERLVGGSSQTPSLSCERKNSDLVLQVEQRREVPRDEAIPSRVCPLSRNLARRRGTLQAEDLIRSENDVRVNIRDSVELEVVKRWGPSLVFKAKVEILTRREGKPEG